MTKINPIAYHLPDFDTTVIDTWSDIAIGQCANDAVDTHPNLFYFATDSEGVQHFCSWAIEGKKYPQIVTLGGTYKALDFVTTMEQGIIEGGCWHPVRKPPRPLI